jgi:DNA-binding MarR family transcriptional regulator
MSVMATTPRWLSDEEQHAWRRLMAMQRHLFDALDRQLTAESGMPHGYYLILAMLSEAPGRSLRMTELASLTNSSQSRLSHAVARLEEAGWVRRARCETDRRGQTATLTDAGYDVLVAAAPGHVAAVRATLFDRLTPDQVKQLTEICTAVLAPPAD